MPARRWLLLALAAGCAQKQAPPPRVDAGSERPAAAVPPIGRLRARGDHPILSGGLLADGTPVLALDGARPRPLPPAAIRLPLDEGASLVLAGGDQWVLVALPDPRWLMPAHSRAEIDAREAELAAAAARLPASVAATIRPRLRLIASVSVAEGRFGGVATRPRDTAASLGIFQWAMPRRVPGGAGSSLATFFDDLRRRARAETDPAARALYESAWRQCRDAGLDLRDGALLLRGEPAAADEMVRALQPAMETGALRTYQLVAAADWIDRVAGARLRRTAGTVGQMLRSDRALSTAVLLGVNRPAWVVPSLEAAIARVGAADEGKLVWEFRHQALARYRDEERERRAMRLIVSEAAW